ncbi:DUF397 domain-containing protein [Lipingzhangella sp. LS1_29]|uniref:DUF397 domain-containing protein n=1 Tax=Lipingzhangella rawalii TaxID=2055835 RepID=A0ABU2H643_9ACTN|nr:DUF397 domain-containing protein [Lipingzhangella rawalii]MDS1270760.1 DUF397 domain-containing protein [Lipingzhangella rawalii]
MRDIWYKSSHSGGNNDCVECRTTEGRVEVRDSRYPDLGHFSFPPSEWRALLGSVRRGEV